MIQTVNRYCRKLSDIMTFPQLDAPGDVILYTQPGIVLRTPPVLQVLDISAQHSSSSLD